MSRILAFTLALVFLLVPVVPAEAAQGEKKPLSPPATAEGVIGSNRILVHYSAPSMRGRTIMGGLVPFERVWRTGANAATTLITQQDVRIGDLLVPKGTYTLYTIPTATNWTLIVNKQTGQWGTQYDQAQDLGRVPMTVRAIDEPVETFAIAVEPRGPKKGVLELTWETTEASVPITLME